VSRETSSTGKPSPEPDNSSKNTASASGAVVLLSGGLDSTVALAETLTRRPVLLVLTFDYGQRAARREIAAAAVIAAHYGLTHRILSLPWLSELLPDALNAACAPEAGQSLESENESETLDRNALFDVRRVWVPNRNGLFLNIAACFAEALHAETVVFGANAEEGESFPDNTPAFRDRLNAALAFSTLSGVTVETPVGHLHKNAIVARGRELNVPFQLIWSCYEGTETPCNQCPSCLRLNAALTDADQVGVTASR
jgi:7-cyano-7-deazaguanine synthase